MLRARWPGAAGNFIVTFDVKVGPNILVQPNAWRPATLSGALRWDTVLVRSGAAALPAVSADAVT